MKKIKLALRLTIVLCMMIGGGLVWTQPNGAWSFDCEINRWNAFLNANDVYTSTFRLWYRNDPTTCSQACNQQCQNSNDPNCYSNCLTACPTERLNGYLAAQDGIMSAGSQSCEHNPDQCDNARMKRDQCSAAYNAHWEYPVYDENNQVDGTWWSYVAEEHSACWAASGIHLCE